MAAGAAGGRPRRSPSPRFALLHLLCVLIALLLACAGLPAAAQAGAGQLSILQDDALLLDGGPAAGDAALARMAGLGVDYARVTVEWGEIARQARSTPARRARFRPDDPSTYPAAAWDGHDGLVRSAHRHGVGVHLVLSGPGPPFAHARAPRSRRDDAATWKPSARAFGAFVAAVGTRYSGTYRDENEGSETLPRVAFWSLYDEPNRGARLTPQVDRGIPWAPVMYRALWSAGRGALDATGHAADPVLLGETAALGSTAPGAFVRELFCVSAAGRPYAGRDARRRRCSTVPRLGRLRSAAWAHHPDADGPPSPPSVRDPDPDAITLANLAELEALLDRMATLTGRLAVGKAIVLSGLGYDSAPPDPFHGVAPAVQAAYANEADHIAYRHPRVIGQTQSLLRDAAPSGPVASARAWRTRQSGLDLADGTPKPAAAAYRLPLTAATPDDVGGALDLWGQLRFRPNGRGASVQLEFRAAQDAGFRALGGPVRVTNALGFFEARRAAGAAGTVRAVWRDPSSGDTVTSREIAVGP